MKAIVEIRSRKASGKWPKLGPDRYVAVQLVPDGVEPLAALRRDVAKKRGIEIVYCGEGYRQHTGPRSSLGIAIAEAEAIAARVNAGGAA
jgi:hypothetical protein